MMISKSDPNTLCTFGMEGMLIGILPRVAHIAPHGAIDSDVGVLAVYGYHRLTNKITPDVLYPLQDRHM